MSAFTKFNCFPEDLGRKVHNLHTDSLKVFLTNIAPPLTATTAADLTEIPAANGYPAGGGAVGGQSYSQTGGVAKLIGTDVVFTAVGGSFGPARYAVLHNVTANRLIGFWDRGASVTISSSDADPTLTVDFSPTAGILTVG